LINKSRRNWDSHIALFFAKAVAMRGSSYRGANRKSLTAPAILGAAFLVIAGVAGGPERAFAKDGASSSCFLGGIAHRPDAQAKAIERATIFIALVKNDGTLVSQGTGFIARGADGSRIVTAAHVVLPKNSTQPDERLMAFFSDGSPLGTLRVAAAGPRHRISLGAFDIVDDDVAVVEPEKFVDSAARKRFAQIEGLPVMSNAAIRIGEASDPVGAFWGFSGAAAVNRQGQVVGVLTDASFRGRTTLELGSIQETNAAGKAVSRAVTLPTLSLVVVEPLRAPEIQSAFGPSPISASGPEADEVALAGFPLASCASSSAVLQSVDSAGGERLLSRWQEMGPVGAWFLQPPLNQTKLKLTP
jgi:hypothetical protein